MATKNVNKTRLLMKHDIEANWLKAENFIPLEGEIVVYDADETHSRPRMKIGDGETQVGALSFVSPETIEPHMQLVTNADGETVWEERTHYVGPYKEYIPEASLTVVTDEAFTGFSYPYAALELPNFNPAEYDINEIYTITYNSVNYDCKFTYISGYGLCAGNLSALNGPSNNEPFAIAIMNAMDPVTLMVLAIDQADNATITLKISNDTARVKKLDKKFMPDGLFYMEHSGGNLIAQCDSIFENVDGGSTDLLYPLEEGKTYTIIIDGVTYQSTCKKFSSGGLTVLVLGDAHKIDGSFPQTDENYAFITAEGAEGPLGYVFSNYASLNGKSFTITLNEEYSKLPSYHIDFSDIEATDDEILEAMASLDMLPVVTDESGAILTDENSNILLI